MAAISPLGMAIIAILAKIRDCSDAETNKYFQSEKSEWGVNALGVLCWLADHTCHELHDSIKLHSSCIMRSNHVQERLCLEPSERRPAGRHQCPIDGVFYRCQAAKNPHGSPPVHSHCVIHDGFLLYYNHKTSTVGNKREKISSRVQIST